MLVRQIVLLVLIVSIVQAQHHAEYFTEPFDSPQEVTEACLTCHEEVGNDIIHTRHWNWSGLDFQSKLKENLGAGKKNIINNFCIAVPSNLPRCTSCHIGYGWKDKNFDFTEQNNIDCLVCHDQTGEYKKIPTGAGMPDENVDLLKVAQNVGNTSRQNCGSCHFDGGGGVGVKHGDMDDQLYEPSPELDVHMGGLDFNCSECHASENHKIAGASHGSMSSGKNHFSCTTCHEGEIHKMKIIDKHTASVACETCHIPEYGRGDPTKVYWNWETAGQDIEPPVDEYGKETYMKKKGSFIWGKDVKPVYSWYDGSAEYKLIGDEVTDIEPVKLNDLNGDISDKNSKITPFKVMKGRQPYDPVNRYMVVPNLYGKEGYWKTYDWKKASEVGMKEVGLEFSGEIKFVETEMYWPINHMVPPAKNALRCTECHGEKGDRLDWKKLGYSGDPLKTKGRFTNGIVK